LSPPLPPEEPNRGVARENRSIEGDAGKSSSGTLPASVSVFLLGAAARTARDRRSAGKQATAQQPNS